ncbi:MAG TPA: SDR family NAD(P)-dependent oxidoreductase [Flavobacterium lutivivi]|nr:SDR family NAD(P)-dependent oxidoreductase [Flavobacterium lutivivi]
MTKISILGCGWLGLPLAKVLVKNGFSVKGSTTTQDKIDVLKQSGIEPFLFALNPENIQGNAISFLEHSEVLIINIPPKLRGNSKEDFVGKMKTLIPFIEKSAVEKVLFVSSTSVYADENVIVTEETPPQPETESGRQLLQSEQLLQNNTHFKTTIVRFGGLIGEDRHPIRFLSGRDAIENPNAPINLIHLEDCIGIITQIIQQNSWGEIYNGVAPFHPSRESYYVNKAIELNLELPKFNHSNPSIGKTIASNKLETILNYEFIKKTL